MTTWKVALCGLLLAAPVYAQETGECLTIPEANGRKDANGDVIVAQGSIVTPTGGFVSSRYVLMRKDGTFFEVSIGPDKMVCHIQDFIGDPRVPAKGA